MSNFGVVMKKIAQVTTKKCTCVIAVVPHGRQLQAAYLQLTVFAVALVLMAMLTLQKLLGHQLSLLACEIPLVLLKSLTRI